MMQRLSLSTRSCNFHKTFSVSFSRLLRNVFEIADEQQDWTKKHDTCEANEYLELIFSTPITIQQLVSQQSANLLLVIFVLLWFTGCASQEIIPAPEKNTAPIISSEVEILKNQIIQLEKIIVEKDALIKQQKIKQKSHEQVLQEVNKEAARTQVKLHRLATKPGTASAIAEVEVALEQLRRQKNSVSDQTIHAQAQQLIETASVLHQKDQYATAMNYVTQARYLINKLTNSNVKEMLHDNNAQLVFQKPLKLIARSPAYLRHNPSNQAKILKILKKGTIVTATGSQGSWLRVRINDHDGWIFNTLLELMENQSL